jgi:hypothetical protein
LAVGSGSSRSNRKNNFDKKECVEGSRNNTPFINSSGPGDEVTVFKLRTFITRLGIMGDNVKSMSKLFLREIGEPALMALLEPNRNLVLFGIVCRAD